MRGGLKPSGRSSRRRRRAPWEDSSGDDGDEPALVSDSSGGEVRSDSGSSLSSASDSAPQRGRSASQRVKKERANTILADEVIDDVDSHPAGGQVSKRQRTAPNEEQRVDGEPADGRRDDVASRWPAAASTTADPTNDEPLSDLEEIETEPEFDDGYDSQGYGDEQDRLHLLSLTAVERETILAERFERRQREYEAWQFRKALRERRRAAIEARKRHKTIASAGGTSVDERERTKKKTRKQALDALARAKRRGKASSRKRSDSREHIEEESDEASSDWSTEHSSILDRADSSASDAYASDDLADESYGIRRSMPVLPTTARRKPSGDRSSGALANPMGFADLVNPQTGEPSPLVLTRAVVERFHQKPWFTRFALGSFVRVPLPVQSAPVSTANAIENQQSQQRYVLARVSAILKAPRLYPVPSAQLANSQRMAATFYVGFRIQAELCGRQRRFTVDQLSRHPPTEMEWMHYEKRHREQRLPLPSREETDTLCAEKAAFMRGEIAATEEELVAFQAEFERLHPEAVNYARRITQVRAQLAHAQETGDQQQQTTLATELQRLMDLEAHYGQRPRENSSSGQVRDLLLSRRHTVGSGDVAGVVEHRKSPGANLPLAASLMLLKRTVEEQRSAELDPFARRVARGTSYFFTQHKTSSTASLQQPDSLQRPADDPLGSNEAADSDTQQMLALQTLLPQIERFLWHGPLLEPLRNMHVSTDTEDVYTASRACYERHLGAPGD
jgi:hypothetical protein